MGKCFNKKTICINATWSIRLLKRSGIDEKDPVIGQMSPLR